MNRRQYVISRYTLLTGEVNSTLFAFLELVRRFIWNFFRLENEHLNNCGEFRAVRDISLAPLKLNELETLKHIVDSVEEVGFNRRQRKLQ